MFTGNQAINPHILAVMGVIALIVLGTAFWKRFALPITFAALALVCIAALMTGLAAPNPQVKTIATGIGFVGVWFLAPLLCLGYASLRMDRLRAWALAIILCIASLAAYWHSVIAGAVSNLFVRDMVIGLVGVLCLGTAVAYLALLLMERQGGQEPSPLQKR
ncbi:MAG TPA: hypothetical protein VKT32_00425 [Chthonomonadaceae bacterium]|nr:hypothetical protein [Chthonomonadaceae bacterium]